MEREKEEHKSAEHVRESERNIGVHACMHIWSNQKEYSRTECTSAIGLNKQTYVLGDGLQICSAGDI